MLYKHIHIKFWGSRSRESSPALFLWNLEREDNEVYLFCPQIYDNLISDEEIELDFPISHHDISVMELADQ